VTPTAEQDIIAGRRAMRTKKFTVRLSIIGQFLVYFLVFLLWFHRWQHAPNSSSTRILSIVFGAMTAVLAAVAGIGGFFSPFDCADPN
jgi:hypothetical protein